MTEAPMSGISLAGRPTATDPEHDDRMNLVDRTVRFGTMTPPDIADSISTTQLYEIEKRLDDLENARAIFRDWTAHLDTTERQIREQLARAVDHGRDDTPLPSGR